MILFDLPKKSEDAKKNLRDQQQVVRCKHYYANENNFKKFNQIIPTKYENKLVTGDCVQVLKNLPGNCVDLVLTSPPYNFGMEYENTDDVHTWETYFKTLFSAIDECIRVLKYGGRLVINVQPSFYDYVPTHHIISNYVMERKMIWRSEIIWDKNNYNCKTTAWGSWKSPSSPYMKYTWEFLEVFCKGDIKKHGERKDIDITEEEFKSWIVGKWSIAPENKMKKFGHSAMFPEKLVERVLKLFSYKNDLILDPFNGAGTTTAVAKRLGRRYLGIDISDEYNKVALQRLEEIGSHV